MSNTIYCSEDNYDDCELCPLDGICENGKWVSCLNDKIKFQSTDQFTANIEYGVKKYLNQATSSH